MLKEQYYLTNPGKVIFKDYLGIYGDTIIVDHGLRNGFFICTYTSSLNVEVNDEVKQVIK